MRTVLFVGAGGHQRRAIPQAREQGIGVVAVDGDPDALGLAAPQSPFAAVVAVADTETAALDRAEAAAGLPTADAEP